MNFKMKKYHVMNEEGKLDKFLEMYDNKFIKYIPTKNNNLSFMFIPDVSKKDPEYVENIIKQINKGVEAKTFQGDVRVATIDFETEDYFVGIHFTYAHSMTESMINLKDNLDAFLMYVDGRYEDEIRSKFYRRIFDISRASKKFYCRNYQIEDDENE